MNISLLNIALVSDQREHLDLLQLYLNNKQYKLFPMSQSDAISKILLNDPFDMVIFDGPSFEALNLKPIFNLRNVKLHQSTPFLFILSDEQAVIRLEIYKDEFSSFLSDPVDKFELLSQAKLLLSLGQLNKRVFLYNDVFESEKRLIHHLEDILQTGELTECKNTDNFIETLEAEFVRKMELISAVEMALFLTYHPQNETLHLHQYSADTKKLVKRSIFKLHDSKVKYALESHTPQIFEGNTLLDPFVQELEETIGFEINAMLFAPFMVFHQAQGAMVLINKIYRNSFTENDLSLILLTTQRLEYIYEEIHLRLKASGESTIYPGQDSNAVLFALYKEVLESVEFGILVFSDDFVLRYWNNFAGQILELPDETGALLKDALGESSFTLIREIITENRLPLFRQEMSIINKKSKQLHLGYSIYRIQNEASGDNRFVLTFMEISQTKRLQAEIIRMDRMASLGVLAAGIAHEIRNPLAGIKAMAQTLEEELGDDKTKVEYVERIVRQVNRLDQLLRSFFSYAKPQRPDPIRCKIPDIVNEVLPLFSRKLKDNNITVRERYSRDLKSIFVDFNQIQQVIFNLVLNAIEAMQEGGELQIRARLPEETQPLIDRRQRIPKLFSDVYNEITISDNGSGMDEDTLNKVFNPFYTTKANGTGLGLSIVYQIIREHGGQITVESLVGKGTTFKILLPVYIEHDKN